MSEAEIEDPPASSLGTSSDITPVPLLALALPPPEPLGHRDHQRAPSPPAHWTRQSCAPAEMQLKGIGVDLHQFQAEVLGSWTSFGVMSPHHCLAGLVEPENPQTSGGGFEPCAGCDFCPDGFTAKQR